MQWWQTLLIALCPSILSTIVAIVVPVTQIRSAKKERLAKYQYEMEQYISHTRFDMEFEIYKELSEKVVTLVSYCLSLFSKEFDYSSIGTPSQNDDDFSKHNKIVTLLNDANEAINKYAVFIPEKWYEKFDQIKVLCRKQLDASGDYILDGKIGNRTIRSIKNECKKRNRQINNVFDELVNELREYILKIGTNSTEKGSKSKKTAK